MDYSLMKLGKLPAKQDKRTIKLSTIMQVLPPYPDAFDVDSQYPELKDSNMYGNDKLGDCVIAGRAHQTLRFEEYEQKTVIPISDTDVTTEYFKESGGADSGLNMLNSLNAWRAGWSAASNVYSIYAYAQIDVQNQNEVMAACYLLNGLYIGVLLPYCARSQTIWDAVDGPQGVPGSWNGIGRTDAGHCIYILAYDKDGLTCVTWGERKQMTWAFFQKYCDEAFGIVDNKDDWVANDPIDVTALNQILAEITGQPIPNPIPTPPKPPCCPVIKLLNLRRKQNNGGK